ncbi:hypothetical protein JKP88DRAFT_249643 [Tribonema minus]|uniref:Kinesin light chain n=1 Tax=Tribonema minus TaxID=303371 RepID=A0A835YMB4_9STRA|nr:hypothetical protein JKP88DRAFT_249643 [Tribonema minus]
MTLPDRMWEPYWGQPALPLPLPLPSGGTGGDWSNVEAAGSSGGGTDGAGTLYSSVEGSPDARLHEGAAHAGNDSWKGAQASTRNRTAREGSEHVSSHDRLHSHSLFYAAEMLMLKGDYQKAEQLLCQALALDINDITAALDEAKKKPPRSPRDRPQPQQVAPAPIVTLRSSALQPQQVAGAASVEDCLEAIVADLNNLGLVAGEQGKFGEAEAAFRQALAVATEGLKPDDDRLAMWESNLARLLSMGGRHVEALQLFDRAAKRFELALGPNHLDTLTVKEWMACLHLRRGELHAAEAILTPLVGHYEAALGPHHPRVGGVARNLATLLLDLGKGSLAEPLLRRVGEIEEALHGPDHVETAAALELLASLLESLLACRPDHVETAAALELLASLLCDQGKFDEASRVYTVFATKTPHLYNPPPPPPPLQCDQGKFDEASRVYARVLGISRRALGPLHPRTATAAAHLGLTLARTGDLAGGEALMRESVAAVASELGREHPLFHRTASSLALLLHQQGKALEAEMLLQACIDSTAAVLGDDHKDTVHYRAVLGHIQGQQVGTSKQHPQQQQQAQAQQQQAAVVRTANITVAAAAAAGGGAGGARADVAAAAP